MSWWLSWTRNWPHMWDMVLSGRRTSMRSRKWPYKRALWPWWSSQLSESGMLLDWISRFRLLWAGPMVPLSKAPYLTFNLISVTNKYVAFCNEIFTFNRCETVWLSINLICGLSNDLAISNKTWIIKWSWFKFNLEKRLEFLNNGPASLKVWFKLHILSNSSFEWTLNFILVSSWNEKKKKKSNPGQVVSKKSFSSN